MCVILHGYPMLLDTSALIVEDEYLIASEMQRVLEAAGAAVTIARNTAEGAARSVSRAFDLGFIAIGPNADDPIALLRRLTEAGTAVVAVSSMGEHRRGIPSLDGVVVIVKPFTDEDLLSAAVAAMFAAAPDVKRPS